MKITKSIVFGAVLLFALGALAQDYSKAELAIDYTYFRYNPSHAYTKNGHSLNGGGGSIDYNFTEYLGVKAEFEGYGSYGYTFVIPAPIVSPRGTIPAGTFHANGNLFTYLFGPQLKFRAPHFQPYAHILFGGGHSNVYANLFTVSGSTGKAPAGNCFALAFGGGVDFPVTKSIAIRPAEVDYVLTRFNNSVTGNQSNFRYQAGVVFSF